jgi:hypothetical protein
MKFVTLELECLAGLDQLFKVLFWSHDKHALNSDIELFYREF